MLMTTIAHETQLHTLGHQKHINLYCSPPILDMLVCYASWPELQHYRNLQWPIKSVQASLHSPIIALASIQFSHMHEVFGTAIGLSSALRVSEQLGVTMTRHCSLPDPLHVVALQSASMMVCKVCLSANYGMTSYELSASCKCKSDVELRKWNCATYLMPHQEVLLKPQCRCRYEKGLSVGLYQPQDPAKDLIHPMAALQYLVADKALEKACPSSSLCWARQPQQRQQRFWYVVNAWGHTESSSAAKLALSRVN